MYFYRHSFISATKRHIACNFDDPFLCGYVRPKSGTFYWRHVTHNDAALASGNIINSHPLADEGTLQLYSIM